jgi:hypothetical protein
MTEDPWNKAVRRLINNPTSKAVFAPSPAPAVGELAHMKQVCLELGAHKEDIRGQLATAIARISQLEAGLERQADNMAFVLNHGDISNFYYQKFGNELAQDRALLKGQS